MKRYAPASLTPAVLAAFLFFSCSKTIGHFDTFPDPLTAEEQVAEYHAPLFDALFPGQHLPYLFKKIYDHSGTVKEIDCSFNDDIVPSQLLSRILYLSVVRKGRMLFLIDKNVPEGGTSDTALRVYFNSEGRPDSSSCSAELAPDWGRPVTARYYYKNHRITTIVTRLGSDPSSAETNTVTYDAYGNPLSFSDNENSYEYDYTKRPKQQFYADDYMVDDQFFVLQYLGYYPEFNCPVNLRTKVHTVDFIGGFPITGHQFDAEGRLIGYDFNGSGGHVTITWKGH